MPRSSTFSFDTLELPRRVPRGLLLALALLLGVEFGVARQSWFWRDIPKSATGIVDAMESQVIRPAPDPVVVLLGNSRLRDAVAPRLLERHLQIPRGSVLNLALTTGEPFDSLVMYRRNREKLSRARILVVDFDGRYFNESVKLTDRIQRFASLQDRLAIFRGTKELLPSLVGYVWQAYGVRTSLRCWLHSLWTSQTHDVPIAADGRVVWRDAEEDTAADPGDVQRIVDWFYHGSASSFRHLEQLRRLITLAREDGLQIVLVYVPVRDAFADRAKARYPQSYAASMKQLAALRSEADLLICCESARDLGVPDEYYYDYGHMTPLGAAAMTRHLGTRLNGEYYALLHGRQVPAADRHPGEPVTASAPGSLPTRIR